jgi:hypothetical protein
MFHELQPRQANIFGALMHPFSHMMQRNGPTTPLVVSSRMLQNGFGSAAKGYGQAQINPVSWWKE